MKKSAFNWYKNLGLAGMFAAVVLFAGAGCEVNDNGNSDGGGVKNNHIGTWALYAGTAPQGNITGYIRFKSDGSFKISDSSDGTGERVFGTWNRSGDNINGPFTNPGVGEGSIDCVINSGVLVMDYIEYWFTPHKVTTYAGSKL